MPGEAPDVPLLDPAILEMEVRQQLQRRPLIEEEAIIVLRLIVIRRVGIFKRLDRNGLDEQQQQTGDLVETDCTAKVMLLVRHRRLIAPMSDVIAEEPDELGSALSAPRRETLNLRSLLF